MNTKTSAIPNIGSSYLLVGDELFYMSPQGTLVGYKTGDFQIAIKGLTSEGLSSQRFKTVSDGSFALNQWNGALTQLAEFEGKSYHKPFVKESRVLLKGNENTDTARLINWVGNEEIWSCNTAYQGDEYTPTSVDDLVFLGRFTGQKRGDSFALIRLDQETGKMIWKQKDAFNAFVDPRKSFIPFIILMAKKGKIFLCFYGTNRETETYPCIIAVDQMTGEYITKWDFTDFPNIQQSALNHRYSYSFYPRSVQWDETSQKLLQLGSYVIYEIDPDSGKTGFIPLMELFESQHLWPSHSAFLYGDHFYFNSRWDTLKNRKKPRYALAALNIRTHQIDWRYDFPEDYVTNSLYAPMANDHFIAAHDAEKRLHIFEKIS